MTCTCPQLLNTTGLILGMVGVVIIFFFGPPQPSFESGVSLGLEDGTHLLNGQTVAQHDECKQQLRRLYSFMSKSGLVFIFVGFALQLFAAWI
jgi:hypothetical protein